MLEYCQSLLWLFFLDHVSILVYDGASYEKARCAVKKLFFLNAMLMVLATGAAHATNYYVEGIGAYGSYADANSMVSGMVGFGGSINEYVNIYARTFYGSTSSGTAPTQKESKLIGGMGVVDATYYFKYDFPIRLGLTAALGAGYGRAEIKDENTTKIDPGTGTAEGYHTYSDTSPVIGAWGGFKFVCTQRFTLFTEAGYMSYIAFQDKLTDRKVNGVQFLFGMTYTLCGENTRLDQGY